MAPSHQNNFDFFRFIAAVSVWYGHCYALEKMPDPLSHYIPFSGFGAFGVTIFFVISGYFVTMSYDNNRSLLRYAKNRALRILPALFVVVLLSVFVLGPLMTNFSLPNYFADHKTFKYLRCLLIFPIQYELPGVFDGNPTHAVNGSLWTLQHEVRLYVVIGILGVLGILQPRLLFVLLLGLMAIRVYGVVYTPGEHDRVLTLKWGNLELLVRLASEFAIGSFLYLSRNQMPLKMGYFVIAAVIAGGSTFLPLPIGNMMFDIFFAYVIIYLGFLKLPLIGSFGRPGDFSYGFYLWAFPMQQLSIALLPALAGFNVFLFVSFAATLIAAMLSWYLIEKPALALK